MTMNALMPANGTYLDSFDISGASVQLLWTDTTPTVVAKHICEQFGLDWKSQHRKLTSRESGFNYGHMTTVGADGKDREMILLPVFDAIRWVSSISPRRVAESARDRLIAFQQGFGPALIARIEDHWRSIAEEAVYSLSRLRAEVVSRKPLWTRIRDWMAEGWDFEQIWRAAKRPRAQVAEAIGDMQRLGLISAKPAGFPGASPLQLDMFPGQTNV